MPGNTPLASRRRRGGLTRCDDFFLYNGGDRKLHRSSGEAEGFSEEHDDCRWSSTHHVACVGMESVILTCYKRYDHVPGYFLDIFCFSFLVSGCSSQILRLPASATGCKKLIGRSSILSGVRKISWFICFCDEGPGIQRESGSIPRWYGLFDCGKGRRLQRRRPLHSPVATETLRQWCRGSRHQVQRNHTRITLP